MRVFVGYGYNSRDVWIEEHVFPILRAAGFAVVDGKDLAGQQLSEAVKNRLNQSDVAVGFLTIREGQEQAEFSSHIWVHDELTYAATARQIPILQVREIGVRVPETFLAGQVYIPLDQADRLACVSSLLIALGKQHLQRIQLQPDSPNLQPRLMSWRHQPSFRINYRVRDELGVESEPLKGRLEAVNQEFFLNVRGLFSGAQVDVEGVVDGAVCFSSGWVSNNGAVPVKVYESKV